MAIHLIVDNKLAWPMVLIILNVLTSATQTNNVLGGINSRLFTMILMCAFRKKLTPQAFLTVTVDNNSKLI